MNILPHIFGIAIGYIVCWFFLSRFVVPFLGWLKTPIPKRISKEMEKDIERLKKKAAGPYHFVELAYGHLTSRFSGKPIRALEDLGFLLVPDVDTIYSRKKPIHCNQLNHLMRIFLVKSGYFKDKHIRFNHMFYLFNIHQYSEVRLDRRWVVIDPWAGAHLKYAIGQRPSSLGMIF